MRNRGTRKAGRARRVMGAGSAAVAALALAGCDDEYLVVHDCPPPEAPAAVYSITGDEAVTVVWTADDDTMEFVIYRAPAPDGVYREIGHTRHDSYTDYGVENGRTYYYAVTGVNACGWESDLSREIAMDTPRPEGSAELRDAGGPGAARSGWDFSAYRAQSWDAASTDVYFIVDGGVPFLVAADLDTDVQDAGFADFDEVGWAPDGGWNPTGAVEAVEGHCYLVWTRDNHYAKVRVRDVHGDAMAFDWAYQTDAGNPELKPRLRQDGSGAGPLAGSRAL